MCAKMYKRCSACSVWPVWGRRLQPKPPCLPRDALSQTPEPEVVQDAHWFVRGEPPGGGRVAAPGSMPGLFLSMGGSLPQPFFFKCFGMKQKETERSLLAF